MTEQPDRLEIKVVLSGGSLAVWRQIVLMQSPAYRCLTKSGHLALARIEIALAAGRHRVTHKDFQKFGIARDSISHCISELEALGIVNVQRHAGPHANSFEMSDRWRGIASLAEAKTIRDQARGFGLFARRKRERETARIARAQRLDRLKQMLNAPAKAPAFAALDATAIAVLEVIVDAIGRSAGVVGAAVGYDAICDRLGIGRNTLARSLKMLQANGFVEVTRGRRTKNIYRLAQDRKLARSAGATQDDAR